MTLQINYKEDVRPIKSIDVAFDETGYSCFQILGRTSLGNYKLSLNETGVTYITRDGHIVVSKKEIDELIEALTLAKEKL